MDNQLPKPVPIKKVTVRDLSQIPSNHSTTPGGTLFSTTPGGTRIIYERDFILSLRNSPAARSPPPDMIFLPEKAPNSDDKTIHACNGHKVKDSLLDLPESISDHDNKSNKGDDAPFEMDI
uniref:Eukaryotic translation initiation factor 4E binding protein 1 n=1 Tax=Schistosoma japonicum TaxID=6182 RepID=C1LKR0_SCHJA|nr:eukaryotic translation initiation factor 4E binding protein 1 [Schistosoma japonicum]